MHRKIVFALLDGAGILLALLAAVVLLAPRLINTAAVKERALTLLERETGRASAVHRAGKSLGEWIHRVVQRETAGRVAEPGDLLHAEGGPYSDRAVASTLQWSTTA
jgi:hypothetical protein